jgi:Zn finger protein HypA/HybF involved in hydrogenase expression
MSRRRNWEYNVHCQECGHEEKSKTKNVYRCDFCGSLDVDVDDGWDNFLLKYSRHEVENGISSEE